ncbi:MAG: cytochrome c oxidase subunit II [Chitinophagales bacterium]|nr:cytochrome c oxidase subunit II [Chitinophagales bacterium]MDW8428587.1 cytochrome c oxidase subunit II [Chitinophagales bacterium]
MGTTIVITIAVVLFVLVVFQLARMMEYVSILRGEEKSRTDNDQLQGKLMLVFLIGGFIALGYSLWAMRDHLWIEPAAVHARWLDSMFFITLFFTGIIFVLTQVLLFYFAYKYRHRPGRQALYYPENTKLEMWWTVIPAIVLTTLVIIGVYRWFQITGPEPEDSMVVEITGQQFLWNYRYPGPDNKLGDFEFRYISGINKVGIDFNDPASRDDFMATEMHAVVNKPILLRIRAKDVIHSVGIPYMRVKMDAVPGLVTRFWFIPTITTKEMRERTGNPDFNYEIVCDQLCGTGHYGMKGILVVETQEEFDAWAKSQPSFYETYVKGTEEEVRFAQVSEQLKKEREGQAQKGAKH